MRSAAKASVWDREEYVPADELGNWEDSQGSVVELTEGHDGNGPPAKRAKIKGKQASKASKAAPIVLSLLTDSDDDDLGADAASDDELGLGNSFRAKAQAKAASELDALEDSLCGSDSKAPTPHGARIGHGGARGAAAAAAAAGSSHTHAGAASGDVQSAGSANLELQRVLKESRMWQQKLKEASRPLDDEEELGDDEDLLGGVGGHIPLSRHRLALVGSGSGGGAAGSGDIECDDDEAAAGPSSNGGACDAKVTIIVQCKQGSVSIKMRKCDPFSKLQRAFLKAGVDREWFVSADPPPLGFKLKFDGELLAADDTPEGADMEGDEKVDATWKAVL
ncbi:hypothetical protein FOA52_010002 [Chlamydomonas sp. UWO 241]|nr:hypothetical protein FOA52_010002 [Chlamydomonas sp. UWO 241]